MQVPHSQVPGDDPCVEIHGCHHQPVPQLSVPHIFLGEHKAQECGSAYRTHRTDNGTQHGYFRRLEKPVNAKRADVILEMQTLGPKQNHAPGAQIIGADGIDKNIVKRINTNYGTKCKQDIADSAQHIIAEAVVHFGFAGYFLAHLFSS